MENEDTTTYTNIGFMAQVPLERDVQARIEAVKDAVALLLHKEGVPPSIATCGLALAAFLSVDALAQANGMPAQEDGVERTLLAAFGPRAVRLYLDAPVPPKRDEIRIDSGVGEA